MLVIKLREKIQEISDLGTIKGIEKISEIWGEDYIYPKITFYALDYGIFKPEESHFVMKDVKIILENQKIEIVNEKRNYIINYQNFLDNKYFNGNKLGNLNSINGQKLIYIEFSTEDYFIEIGIREKEMLILNGVSKSF